MTTNHQEGSMSSEHQDSGGSSEAKERAQQVADSAAQESQHVAGVAKEEAKKVAEEAKDQVLGLVDEAASQVEEQSRVQKSRLAETLRGFGADLERMSARDTDSSDASASGAIDAPQLVRQAATQAQELAERLENKEPQELLDDVRRFARQKPGTFILGALAAGIVVGRLTRGAKTATDETSSQTSSQGPTSTPPAVGDLEMGNASTGPSGPASAGPDPASSSDVAAGNAGGLR